MNYIDEETRTAIAYEEREDHWYFDLSNLGLGYFEGMTDDYGDPTPIIWMGEHFIQKYEATTLEEAMGLAYDSQEQNAYDTAMERTPKGKLWDTVLVNTKEEWKEIQALREEAPTFESLGDK